MFFKRRKVDEWEVAHILHDFLIENNLKSDIYISYEISKRGIVNIKTNKPGLLIGRRGIDIDNIRKEMKEKANVKDIKLNEMRHFVTCNLNGDVYINH